MYWVRECMLGKIQTLCNHTLSQEKLQLRVCVHADGRDYVMARTCIGTFLCVFVLQVSVMFICVRGLDVSTRTGSLIAHKLMKMTQKAAYTMVSV